MKRRIRASIALVLSAIVLATLGGRAATGTISPSPFQLILDANGHPASLACVWTYTAGTSTPVATYTDVGLSVANANPIIASSAGRFTAFLTPGVSYKFVYEAAPCSSISHGSTLLTADNIAATPSSSAALDTTGTAGETLTAGLAVYLSDGSGSKTPGLWYKADSANTYSSTTGVVGFAPSAIASGAVGSIRLAGEVTGLSSLTAGSKYYIGTAGAITSTAPTFSRLLGQADTTTSLVLQQAPPLDAAPPNGTLLIGNGGAFKQATLTAGTGFTVTNGAGTITLANNCYALDKSTTEQDVVSTATETSVYSFSVPANTLSTNRTLRLTVTASYLNNSGGADNFTPRVKFGGTTIASSAPSLGANANRRGMKFVTEIDANGAANSQRAVTIWIQGATAAEAAFDSAVFATSIAYHGSLALDSTGALVVTLTVQHGTSAATISFRRFVALLEICG